MKHILLSLLMALTLSVASCGNSIVNADNQSVEYSGRVDFTNPSAPCFSYSGVSIRIFAKATEVKATIADERGENYLAVIIDRVYQGKLKLDEGQKTYSVASNLTNEVHEIELVKITEQQFGKTTFGGFDLCGGKLVANNNPRTRTIEFIGNSITCAYGNEGYLGERFGPSTENHYFGYAAMVVRSFDANPLMVCKSGIGIYRNYGAPADSGSVDNMTNYYGRTYLYDSLPLHNFNVQPDVVCINLGTNDFGVCMPDTIKFMNMYMQLVDSICTHYNNPQIVSLMGTMLYGEGKDVCRRCINKVVADAKNKGVNISFFEMEEQDRKERQGIDWHPTIRQHLRAARELMGYLSLLKGWTIDEQVLRAEQHNNQVWLYANTLATLSNPAMKNLNIEVDGKKATITNTEIDEANCLMIVTLAENGTATFANETLNLGVVRSQIVAGK